MEDLLMRLELMALQDRYVSVLDNDRIEEWPGLFTEDCLYQIISKENEDQGLPAPVIHCDNARMLRDRVTALRHANIYEQPQYRHCLAGLEWQHEAGGWAMQTSYVVVNTSRTALRASTRPAAISTTWCAVPEGLRFRSKRCIYDTLRVQTVLAYPI